VRRVRAQAPWITAGHGVDVVQYTQEPFDVLARASMDDVEVQGPDRRTLDDAGRHPDDDGLDAFVSQAVEDLAKSRLVH
jgi:hypothetical protein